jgi:hypothetical protein
LSSPQIANSIVRDPDTYQEIIESGFAKLRMYPCVDSHGNPVLYDRETIELKKKAMGSGVFASQMMCDPKQASTMGFKKEWLQVWDGQSTANLNLYIIVDPAGTKSKRADYTTMWVIGLGADRNYYILGKYSGGIHQGLRHSHLQPLSALFKLI